MKVYTAHDLFVFHRTRAKHRGIEFQLTFEEWLAWWIENLGPDWRTLRGCRHGQYVMARFKDVGPYALSNIKCILATENTEEAAPQYGEVNGRAKLTSRQVGEIIASSKPRRSLARQYRVSLSLIHQIKMGDVWPHLPRIALKQARKRLRLTAHGRYSLKGCWGKAAT